MLTKTRFCKFEFRIFCWHQNAPRTTMKTSVAFVYLMQFFCATKIVSILTVTLFVTSLSALNLEYSCFCSAPPCNKKYAFYTLCRLSAFVSRVDKEVVNRQQVVADVSLLFLDRLLPHRDATFWAEKWRISSSSEFFLWRTRLTLVSPARRNLR